MADSEHLKILKQGVKAWNKWRENSVGMPILNQADLSKANLSKANLELADLSGANLIGAELCNAKMTLANLSKSDLRGANLHGAILDSANLSNANLSNPDLETSTKYSLRGSSFWRTNLSNANLRWAKLKAANLRRVNLSQTDLTHADLRGSNLSGADLTGAQFYNTELSGAIVDKYTKYRKIIGCHVGVNGFWSEETDSAALMRLSPPGNSMQGANPEAVIESLTRARKLHGYSMTFVGIFILIVILGQSEIKFPNVENIQISRDLFGLLATVMSLGILSIVNLLMSDALKGVRYLNDRQSAMSVGNFPWVLSKYAGEGFIFKIITLLIRLFMSFHPVVYIPFLIDWKVYQIIGKWTVLNIFAFITLSILLLCFSAWTFLLSQRFQRPILFDKRTEEERQDPLEKLTKAVETQTNLISDLFERFKRQQNYNAKDSDHNNDIDQSKQK